MRVLVACEFSGKVRDAFIRAGHSAMSCDLLPTESPGPHFQGDVTPILDGWEPAPEGDDEPGHEYAVRGGLRMRRPSASPNWDLMVAHPPCTYLCSSGLHWNGRRPGRQQKTEEALDFVRTIMGAPVARIAVENPVGCISSRIRKPEQIIQPYNFGHDISKTTCLWLKNLPPLTPTAYFPPRLVDGKRRWGNQTDSGQNNVPPSKDRGKVRSETYDGVAEAMAQQWGCLPILR